MSRRPLSGSYGLGSALRQPYAMAAARGSDPVDDGAEQPHPAEEDVAEAGHGDEKDEGDAAENREQDVADEREKREEPEGDPNAHERPSDRCGPALGEPHVQPEGNKADSDE